MICSLNNQNLRSVIKYIQYTERMFLVFSILHARVSLFFYQVSVFSCYRTENLHLSILLQTHTDCSCCGNENKSFKSLAGSLQEKFSLVHSLRVRSQSFSRGKLDHLKGTPHFGNCSHSPLSGLCFTWTYHDVSKQTVLISNPSCLQPSAGMWLLVLYAPLQ